MLFSIQEVPQSSTNSRRNDRKMEMKEVLILLF